MKVVEILNIAAELLGRDDWKSAAASPTSTELQERMLCCYNIVENEIALDYYPLKKKEQFYTEDGEVFFTSFSLLPVNILKVTKNGTRAGFELFPDRISTKERGTVEVTYCYSPEKKTLSDACEFGDRFPARLIALGICAEMLYGEQRYDEGKQYGLRYYQALRDAGIYRRALSVRSRRWV